MEIQEKLQQHFPTPVLVRDHHYIKDLTINLRKLIEEIIQTETNASKKEENTTQGGFQTKSGDSILDRDHAAIRTLKGEIIWPGVERYMHQVLNCDPLLTPVSLISWVVSLGAGDWQAPHFHPKEYTVISGVYYVWIPDLPEPEGYLEFINPNLNAVTIGNQTTTQRHCPKSGQLILFPPYYMHYVHPIKTSSKRHVIAFDVRLNQNQHSKPTI